MKLLLLLASLRAPRALAMQGEWAHVMNDDSQLNNLSLAKLSYFLRRLYPDYYVTAHIIITVELSAHSRDSFYLTQKCISLYFNIYIFLYE